MPKNKALTLSIVIPVYNEEIHLKKCLEAITKQSKAPDEVIVVDNNSTDASAAIADSYSFVKLIHEPKQGLIAARNSGMDVANGDILARIDADSILNPDWVERAHYLFANRGISAITGPARTMLIPYFIHARSTFWSRLYFVASEAFFRIRLLWGANMALRGSVWRQIRPKLAASDKLVHEDQDISYQLAAGGYKIRRDNNLIITTDGEIYHNWPKFAEYMRRRWRTKHHHLRSKTVANSEALLIPRWRAWPVVVVMSPVGVLFALTSMAKWLSYSKWKR